jgi:hypothetical protein
LLTLHTPPNNSLRQSAGSAFFNLNVGFEVVANHRARSTQPYFAIEMSKSFLCLCSFALAATRLSDEFAGFNL